MARRIRDHVQGIMGGGDVERGNPAWLGLECETKFANRTNP